MTMLPLLAVVAVVVLGGAAAGAGASATLMAGAARVDATPAVGVPLAAYNHGPRRVPLWPLPAFTNYTTWLMPSQAPPLTPIYARALVLRANATGVALVALDAVGADATLCRDAFEYAVARGFTAATRDGFVCGASHTHSGPGALASDFLWTVAPATDVVVPEVAYRFALAIARALLDAQAALRPAALAVGDVPLPRVTSNRRAGVSPRLGPHSVDDTLTLLRVDARGGADDGAPLALVWNFAIHGTCYGADNMHFSSDIAGTASNLLEAADGPHRAAPVALFFNGAAGDVHPADGMCDKKPAMVGSGVMAAAAKKAAATLAPVANVTLAVASVAVDFGRTNLNFTLARFDNCTSGGALDVCSICRVLRCEDDIAMPSSWVTTAPRFTAISIVEQRGASARRSVLATVPGEALTNLGWDIRNDTARAGYEHTLLAGYAQAHMGYFATAYEYDLGGYESQLTLWGIGTAQMVRNGVVRALHRVAKMVM